MSGVHTSHSNEFLATKVLQQTSQDELERQLTAQGAMNDALERVQQQLSQITGDNLAPNERFE